MRYIAFALLILTVLISPTHASSDWVQWTSGAGHNDHWYRVVTSETSLTWDEARTSATAEALQKGSGHLATLTSAAEDQFLLNLIQSTNLGSGLWGPWLGGYQCNPADGGPQISGGPSDCWAWVTGEAWSYTNWASEQPNDFWGVYSEQHLGYEHGRGSQWNDYRGSGVDGMYSYVVEAVAEPNSLIAMLGLIPPLAMAGRKRAR